MKALICFRDAARHLESVFANVCPAYKQVVAKERIRWFTRRIIGATIAEEFKRRTLKTFGKLRLF